MAGPDAADESFMTDAGIEKRRYHRSRASLEVRLHSLPGETADLELVTIDISVGGARCAGERAIALGTALRVHFTLEGGDLAQPESIAAEAQVIRCSENPSAPAPRRFEIALQFTHLDDRDRRKLQSYLNSL